MQLISNRNNDDTTDSNHDEEHPNDEHLKTDKSKENSSIDADVIKGI